MVRIQLLAPPWWAAPLDREIVMASTQHLQDQIDKLKERIVVLEQSGRKTPRRKDTTEEQKPIERSPWNKLGIGK